MDVIFEEFRKRKKKVEVELEKERISKAMEKQKKEEIQQKNNNTGNLVYAGPQGFRGMDELEKKEFVGLEAEFPSLKLTKQLYEKDKGFECPLDIFTVVDYNYIFKSIIQQLVTSEKKEVSKEKLEVSKESEESIEKQIKFYNIKLSEKKYKIKCKAMIEEKSNVEMQIKLAKVDEETTCVEFTKIGGSSLDYHAAVQNISKKIKEKK